MATRIETEEVVGTTPESSPVELNQADADELAGLPGIGPGLAGRIVTYREENGPFLFAGDIRQVAGIGDAIYADIADRVTVTVPSASDLNTGIRAEDEPDNGAGPSDDAESETPKEPGDDGSLPVSTEQEPAEAAMTYSTPPPLPTTTAEHTALMETEEEAEAPTPPPLAVSATPQTPPEEFQSEIEEESTEASTTDDTEPETEEEEDATMPEPLEEDETEAVSETQVSSETERKSRRREPGMSWVWTAILGAVAGALLGMLLSLLVFAGINGSVDVGQSQAMVGMRGQMNELNVELDAVQGDVSTLQGDVAGLRERVEVLSGLTARMEQAEDALETFTVEIQALQDETESLTTSLGTLADDVAEMGETLDAVQAETEKATSFFEGLQQLMQDVFGQTAEPESRAPQVLEEVDA